MKIVLSILIFISCQLLPNQRAVAANSSSTVDKGVISWNPYFYNALLPKLQNKLNSFGEEVLSQLPPLLVQSLQNKVVINFKSLDTNDTSAELAIPSCVDTDHLAFLLQKKVEQEFDGIKSKDSTENMITQTGDIYGETISPSLNSNNFQINLNLKLLSIILNGEEKAKTYPCGHKNLYRLAKATLIHELSHVYDALNMTAINNPAERKLRAQCAAVGPVSVAQPPVWCRDLMNETKSVSDRPTWKNLMNWNRGLFIAKTKNVLSIRSPDAYEKSDLSEAFAVNMEYFVLDPEYSCRRPEIASYLNSHFKISNNGKPSCIKNTAVRFSTSQMLTNLDLSRLYEIHYLIAAPGTDTESRWGHAMFRLVFCSPKRTTVGPECLQDINDHVVLSYRANISGITKSAIDGLLGKYPSQMFVYTVPEIVSEYTVSEFRDLMSIPLKLTALEKEHFLDRVLTEYWEYQGRYYFLRNNCATEAFDFIKGSVFRPEIQRKVDTIETPMGVYNFLASVNLLDTTVTKDPNKEGRYYFSSHKKIIEKALQQIGAKQKVPDNIEGFADEFTAQTRRDLYQKMTQKFPDQRKNLAIQFYRLERAVNSYLDEQRKGLVDEAIAQGEKSGQVDAAYKENIKKILVLRSRFSPWFLAKNGYGIPSESEMKSDKDLEQDQKDTSLAAQKIDQALSKDFPEMDKSIKEVNSNLLYFFNEIKSSVGGTIPRLK
ncbi:MAG: DUF7844 domain-containing protein [Pseudobdellovibrionaceae bacterium]